MPCVALRACVASFAVLASPPPPPGSKLQRVLNTRALIVQDAGAVNYVHVWDGWVEAPSLASQSGSFQQHDSGGGWGGGGSRGGGRR